LVLGVNRPTTMLPTTHRRTRPELCTEDKQKDPTFDIGASQVPVMPRIAMAHQKEASLTPVVHPVASAGTPWTFREARKTDVRGGAGQHRSSSRTISPSSVHPSDHCRPCDFAHGRRRDGPVSHIEFRQRRALAAVGRSLHVHVRSWGLLLLWWRWRARRRWLRRASTSLSHFPVISDGARSG
jgi:hypothetical protein